MNGRAAATAAPDSQTVLYRLVAGVCRPVVRVLFRPRVRGLENVPTGGFVLSANQLSNLDGFVLAYSLYPRQLRWMGKAELFHPLVAPVLRRLGLFPVRRGEGDLEAVATAVDLVGEGHVVGIFPEGTRRRKGFHKKREARPHTGAARVALAAQVALVPAAIAGTDRLLLLRRWRLTFGRPVPVADLGGNRRLASREATRRLWDAITELEAELQAGTRRPARSLRPRLRLDISLGDLLFGFAACLGAWRRSREERVLQAWAGGDDGLACLSVRSAFDLLLQALALQPGDEVAASALTHPDMIRVLETHGLRALPIDLDPETLAPRPDLLERALTKRTRAVLTAHLFGGRADLEQLAAIARRHGLLLVEDCAQGFRGPENAGDPLADVSLFSFGPIKTATALGGALVRVEDPELRARMRALQETWPVQPRREYAARVVKFVALVLLGRPRAYWLFARALPLLGRDLDTVVNGVVRGFPGPDFAARIRRRPSVPLLALLERRLRRFDHHRFEGRSRLGEHVAEVLPHSLFHPGGAALDRTHWLFPVVPADRARVIASLRRAGFDAATATSSIAAVTPPPDRPDLTAHAAERTVDGVVFLPVYPELNDREVARLLTAVAEADGRGG
jgi:dTDP-4-amino-4,6-dideoxygalactose transaminase